MNIPRPRRRPDTSRTTVEVLPLLMDRATCTVPRTTTSLKRNRGRRTPPSSAVCCEAGSAAVRCGPVTESTLSERSEPMRSPHWPTPKALRTQLLYPLRPLQDTDQALSGSAPSIRHRADSVAMEGNRWACGQPCAPRWRQRREPERWRCRGLSPFSCVSTASIRVLAQLRAGAEDRAPGVSGGGQRGQDAVRGVSLGLVSAGLDLLGHGVSEEDPCAAAGVLNVCAAHAVAPRRPAPPGRPSAICAVRYRGRSRG
jgi:hypothetical protein